MPSGDGAGPQQPGMIERRQRHALPTRRHALLDERLAGSLHQPAVGHAGRARRLTPAALHARLERRDDLGRERRIVELHLAHRARCGRAATCVSSPVTRNVGQADRHRPHCTHVFSSSWSMPRSISDPSRVAAARARGSAVRSGRSWPSSGGGSRPPARRVDAPAGAAHRTPGRPRSPPRTTRCRACPPSAGRRATTTTAAQGAAAPRPPRRRSPAGPASTARRRCRRHDPRDAPTSWCRPTGPHSAAAGRRVRRTGRAAFEASQSPAGGTGLVRRITSASSPSVPSEPTINLGRSKPVTFLTVGPPPLTIRPSADT